MNELEIKRTQYQRVLLQPASGSFFLFFECWFLSLWSPDSLTGRPSVPSKFFGIGVSSVYFYLNILLLFGYVVTSLLFISPNIEKYIKRVSKIYLLGNIERQWALLYIGISIIMFSTVTKWNFITILQAAIFFILGCGLIIWAIQGAKKNHIPLKMIFKKNQG